MGKIRESISAASVTSAFGGLNESRFKYLLMILVLTLFGYPVLSSFLAGRGALINQILYLFLFIWIMGGILSIARSNRFIYVTGLLFGSLVILMHVLHLRTSHSTYLVVHHVLVAILVFYFVAALLQYLFLCEDVTAHTLFAALCSFLLLALGWSLLYDLLETVQPAAFNKPALPDAAATVRGGNPGGSIDPFYFSLVTITTLGYGDISPASVAARTLATAEAFTGQMFIAITIARLVGRQISTSLKSKADL